jgi:hypothetical protein
VAEEKPATPATETAAPDPAAVEADYQKHLASLMKGEEPEEKPEEPEKKPEDPEKPKTDEEEEAEEADKTDAGDDTTEDEDDDGKEKGKYSKAFRELQKRESSIQQMKHEVLQREQTVYKAHQEIERREQELAGFIKQLEVDPYETLLKAGLLSEDAAEYASKQLYYRSRAAQADPRNRAEADRLQREYRLQRETAETRQEVDKLRRQQEHERQQAQLYQARENYSAKLESTVSTYKSKTPLLAAALAKNPQRTLKEIYEVAAELSAAKQQFADPALVVLAWTKARKQLLADHGIAEPVASSEKEKSNSADKKKGPTNGKSKTAVQDSAQLTDEEKDAKYRKQLAAMLRGESVED